MFWARRGISAAVCVAVAGAAAIGPGAPAAHGGAGETRLAGIAPEAVRRSPAAARIYEYVKTPRPGELAWQRIPWLVDLPRAVDLAKRENRPLLLFVSGDDPLEKC